MLRLLLCQLFLFLISTHSKCIFEQNDTAWTTPDLIQWLKSKELRRLARDFPRFQKENQAEHSSKCRRLKAPKDWKICSHSNGNEKEIMLRCSRGAITALLTKKYHIARSLLSHAVLAIPPHRWARLGVAQSVIFLLSTLKKQGRPINIKFLKAWKNFAKQSSKAKQVSSKQLLIQIYDSIVEAAGSPSLDSGITLPTLKAILYRHEFGNKRWGRTLEYMNAAEIDENGNTKTIRKPMMMSDSVTVLCQQTLQWLHDHAGNAIANPSRLENYVELTYPVRALLGVFQNLLFSYDLADSQQEVHTLSLFDKERCPKYTLPVIEYLDGIDFQKANVFEFGVGGSTLWWLKRCSTVTAVDTSAEWIDKVRNDATINQENAQLLHRSSSLAPFSINEKELRHTLFDVILIDGSFSRYDAAVASVDHLAKGGIILLDDADWYSKTAQYLRSQNLIQVDFHGFKPGDGAAARSTSLFLHRDFQPSPKEGLALPLPSRGGISLGSSWDRL